MAASFSILVTACVSALGQTRDCSAPHPELETVEVRGELNQGVEAYKSGQYENAVTRFQKAADLDPCLTMAKLYLGTAPAQNIVPGLDSPENLATAQHAVDVFREVLAAKPHDVISMKAIASIYYNTKKLDDAKVWQKEVLDEDPKDAEASYTVGVIDWTQAYQNAKTALASVGMEDDGQGNSNAPTKVLDKIELQNNRLVPEALEYLNRAMENRLNYADAMVYMNLVYRRKADLDYKDQPARDDDLAKAKEWTAKAMKARKTHEETSSPSPDSPKP